MLLDFSKIGQRDVQGRNGGAVTITAKMYISELGKIILNTPGENRQFDRSSPTPIPLKSDTFSASPTPPV